MTQRVATFDLTQEERNARVYERAARYTDLVSSIVPWLQRRHRERGVLDYLVRVTEGLLEERGIRSGEDRQPPAIAFLDLTGFTALAEERGDAVAAEIATELAAVVQ